MNSTITPEQRSLWRFPRIPLRGLFTTAGLSVDEPALEFKGTATSKVSARLRVAGCVASWEISLHAMLGITHVAGKRNSSDFTFDVFYPGILHELWIKTKNLTESTQVRSECMDFSLYRQDGVLSLCQYLCFKTHYSDRKVAPLLL